MYSLTKVAMSTRAGRVISCTFSNDDSCFTLPSVLYALPDGSTTIGHPPSQEDSWIAVNWFKMSLLHSSDWPDRAKCSLLLQKSHDAALSLSKTPVDVMAEYLSQLWPMVERFAQKRALCGNGGFSGQNLHLVLTVPASWPVDAMARMERAVKEAGILEATQSSTLTFLREQAAAAAACVSKASLSASFQHGDWVGIVDCGGLTGDGATYEVSIRESGYLLNETVAGTSKLCGAMFLEDNFYKLLKKKIAENGAIIQPAAQFWAKTAKWWETTGRAIMFMCNKESEIDFPHQFECRDAPSMSISFSGMEFLQIRESVMEEVVDLVQAQVLATCERLGRPPKCVFLCGGLVMDSAVAREVGSRITPKTRIIGRNRDLRLVACGAVTSVLCNYPGEGPRITTESHLARENYGYRSRDDQPTFWIIKQGDTLSTTRPSSFSVPPTAFQARNTAFGQCLTLSVYRHGPSSSGEQKLGRLTWTAPPVLSPEDKVDLQVLHDTYRGISMFLYHNGTRFGPEKVSLD
ncbi:hypothetical protein QQX98_003643 [Neonectria punicea]|uniref:Uncharacterized protein n=1 Tax=Neonectria punicea TaxID=979145 RepID=A0ABR1HDD6_9HYPO